MSKILITGASGFVGSWIIAEALTRDLEVYAGIRATSDKRYLKDKRINFIDLAYKEEKTLHEQLADSKFDYIIHNAGVVRALESQTFYDVNCNYTKSLIDALQLTKTHPAKFTYMSSLAACGSAPNLPDHRITGDIKMKPPTHYGKSKKCAEDYLKQSPLPYIILRPTAVYGPRDKDILKLFKGIKLGIAPLIGSKQSKLSFIYVKDLARLVLDSTLSEINNKVYPVSDGEEYIGNDFHKTVAATMNKRAIYPRIPMPVIAGIARLTQLKSRLTKVPDTLDVDKVNELKARNWVCDITELKKDFNFAPHSSLEQSLSETYTWYNKHNWI